eukprot:gnl/TRDRNA2_/TRDRNA2_175913_c0_seq1.p1 gnl/TRDRNA2_/TRDRNA2_175913_c0~~gnl/TRDRNA2_/TRDRNA2_175913_c0_seq1.p1  ORF type:complete len:467 (+),score=26.66 gnl/TRDRNA2_/TRDRNA2_175913_c0_seq1:65-1465(+)
MSRHEHSLQGRVALSVSFYSQWMHAAVVLITGLSCHSALRITNTSPAEVISLNASLGGAVSTASLSAAITNDLYENVTTTMPRAMMVRNRKPIRCLTTNPGPGDGNLCVPAGMPCAFPFVFRNKIYNECTTEGWKGPWCLVTWPGKMTGQQAWGNCGSSCLVSFRCVTVGPRGVGPDKPCIFPFTWKNIEYYKCANEDWHVPWCQTTPGAYVGKWGECDTAKCESAPPLSRAIAEAQISCFPEHAKVITRFGPLDISEVHIGDELLGFDHAVGRPEFTRMHAWLHREPNEEGIFMKLHTRSGSIVMSPGHNIAVGNPDNYVFARDARVGDTLLTPNSKASVTSRSQVKAKGIYAPWTATSNLYVGMGEDFFLAHGLANVPSRFTSILNPLFSMLESIFPFIHDLDETFDLHYMHPVVSVFWAIVGTLNHEPLAFQGCHRTHSEEDRMHPMGSLVAFLGNAFTGDVF